MRLLLLLFASVVWAEDFSIAIFSDRQQVAGTLCGGSGQCTNWDGSIDYLTNSTNIATHNIKGVFTVGDNVNSAITSEWNGFLNGSGGKGWNAIRALPGMMWSSACGNHDVVSSFKWRTCESFNDTDKFHPSAYAGKSWYMGSKDSGNNANHYLHWTGTDGIKYGALFMEFYPSENAITWATGILTGNPDRNYILVTHSYILADNAGTFENAQHVTANGTYGPNQGYNIFVPGQTEYATCADQSNSCTKGTEGSQLWSMLIAPNCNIIATFSGHVGGSSGYRLTTNDCGKRVYQVAIQEASDTTAYFLLAKFKPDTNTVQFQHFDAFTGTTRTGSTFVLKTYTDWTPIKSRKRARGGGRMPRGAR